MGLNLVNIFKNKVNWFLGPYVFGATLGTYLLSKEIYVLEHEYYSGLSIIIMIAIAAKKLGTSVAASLDKQIDVSNFFIMFVMAIIIFLTDNGKRHGRGQKHDDQGIERSDCC